MIDITVILTERFENAQVHELLVAKSYGIDHKDSTAVAQWVYDRTNNPAFDDLPRLWEGRCLSVGDIVVVNGDMVLCESNGWKIVSSI